MNYIIIFLLLFLNICSINANQFKDSNKNLSLKCNYAPKILTTNLYIFLIIK